MCAFTTMGVLRPKTTRSYVATTSASNLLSPKGPGSCLHAVSDATCGVLGRVEPRMLIDAQCNAAEDTPVQPSME